MFTPEEYLDTEGARVIHSVSRKQAANFSGVARREGEHPGKSYPLMPTISRQEEAH